jgi:hypothetical protein
MAAAAAARRAFLWSLTLALAALAVAAIGLFGMAATRGINAGLLQYRYVVLVWSLVALLLPLAAHRFRHFKQLKAAAWALLAAANMLNTSSISLIVEVALDAKVSAATRAYAATNAAGLSACVLFSFVAIFAGSAFDAAAGRAALGGLGPESARFRRIATLPRALSASASAAAAGVFASVSRARAALVAGAALAWIGWGLGGGGLAYLTAYCGANREVLGALKLPWIAPSDGIDCVGTLAQFWFYWALATLVLALACALPAARALARFKAALWAALVVSLALNVTWAHSFRTWAGLTSGPFRTALQVSLAGAAIFDAAGITILFSGSAYAYAASRAGMDSLRRGSGGASGTPGARRPARAAFAALQAGAWAAQLVALVGAALCQADASAAGGGIVAASVGAARLGLRYIWYVWAAQLAALLLLAAAARGGARARPFKAAIWLVLTYCVYLNTRVCADVFRVWRGAGAPGASLRTGTQVLFAGLVAWAACAWAAVFAGSAAAWEARHAGGAGGGEGESEGEGEGEGEAAAGGGAAPDGEKALV